MDRKLIDEINRLFDELVRLPWSRVPLRPALRTAAPPAALVVEIPLKEGELGSIALITEGRRVTLVVATRPNRRAPGAYPDTSAAATEHRQTFELPQGTRAVGFEAFCNDSTLRVRIALQADDERRGGG